MLNIFKLKRPKISLLIPFSYTDPSRIANIEWLKKYWKHELPEAELVIGSSYSEVFCKGQALNNAAAKAKGRIFVVLDADAYLPGSIIREAANLILENRKNNLWFVPYRELFRLSREISERILRSDPRYPHRPSACKENIQPNSENTVRYGRRFAAMIMMFHRDAYKLIGGFDERFKGWGGEDVCLMKALDTLYGKHKSINSRIFHLWHPIIGDSIQTRRWEGQENGSSNAVLSMQYHKALGKPSEMKKIIKDARKYRKRRRK
jgi:glycosyltransferase involved in cell wall biosynthesis